MTTFTVTGATELAAGLRGLTDTREITEAGGLAARTMALAISERVPNQSSALAGSIETTVTERTVDVGSRSPYARWFHVPYLSDGGVTYAKKVSKRGRAYGQRIPNDPFMILAVKAVEQQIFEDYLDGTVALVERALASVPKAV